MEDFEHVTPLRGFRQGFHGTKKQGKGSDPGVEGFRGATDSADTRFFPPVGRSGKFQFPVRFL